MYLCIRVALAASAVVALSVVAQAQQSGPSAKPAGTEQANQTVKPPPPAEETSAPYGLNDRFVRVMQGLAWNQMPPKLEFEGKTIELDKSDPTKYLLPLDEAREIIVIADRSASAQLCGMNELALSNFNALMASQQARNKWSREQLHMIKWLHIAVVLLRTQTIEEEEKATAATTPAGQQTGIVSSAPSAEETMKEAKARARAKGICSAANTKRIKSDTDVFLQAVARQIGLDKVDKATR